MAKNNQRDPNLRAATVARVNQLVKGGLTKAGGFREDQCRNGARQGRRSDAVLPRHPRRQGRQGPKATAVARPPRPRPPRCAAASSASARAAVRASPRVGPQAECAARSAVDLPALLNGIAAAINNLLKHVEKTVEENKTLKEQAKRLHAITSLIRGR